MIYYLGYYNHPSIAEDQRVSIPSANTKIDYVAEAIGKSTDETIEIISMLDSPISCSGKRKRISEKAWLRVFPTLSNKKKLFRIINFFFSKLLLLTFFLCKVKKTDVVIVYHSLAYYRIVAIAKYFVRFKLVLEIEEIYSDILKNSFLKRKELLFFSHADSYLFSSYLLNKFVNVEGKPYAVAHGTYKIEPERKKGLLDGKTHIIYAGTLEAKKGGAIAAVKAAKFLDNHYHLHVLGFGSKRDTKDLIELIQHMQGETDCIITFEGVKTGEEYIQFLQSCQIGLSTQNPEEDFNDTSFPSKILSYLSNGLRVVSVRIPAIEESDINNLITYYDIQKPEAIADAIMKVDPSEDFNPKTYISELDNRFVRALRHVV